jgi:Domain of unknown function (DUF4402)
MKTNQTRAALVSIALAMFFCSAFPILGATATALASATVLGPAGDDTANGAVTLSRMPGEETLSLLSAPGRTERSTIGHFRVGGGVDATFSVALPQTVVIRGHGSAIEISGFRAAGAGRLGPDGTSTVAVGADLGIPAGQRPGEYTGSFPITIVYN